LHVGDHRIAIQERPIVFTPSFEDLCREEGNEILHLLRRFDRRYVAAELVLASHEACVIARVRTSDVLIPLIVNAVSA
jgi:hypothetical protein